MFITKHKTIVVLFVVLFLPLMSHSSDYNKMIDNAFMSLSDKIKVDSIEKIKVVAIKDFEYAKDIEIRNVEDKVVKEISKSGKFKVADRKSLEILLKEQALSLTGVTELTEVNKIGKIINVDAFIFGKVNKSGDDIVINLEMREVTTGAIVWNEEFIGEDPDKASLGVGIRLGTYNESTQTYVSGVLGSGLKEWTNIQAKDNAIYVAFLFHFVQRTSFSKAFSFGVDGIFSKGTWQIPRYDDSVLKGNYNLFQTSTFSDYNLTLIPLVRIHPAYLFGLNKDAIVFYIGAGLSTDFVELQGEFRLKQTNGAFDTDSIRYSKVNLNPGNFAYKFGAEIRFSDKYSMFIEAYHLPEMTMKFEDVSSNIAPEFTVKSNTYYGLGAKYYFFSF